jgi:putative FmdB family regulatory protein
MPIYEYACAACGHEFEEWRKMSDPPVKTCPKCKKKKVERLISRTAFQLKGGGWYADLYSSSKPGAEAKAETAKADGAAGDGAASASAGKETTGAAASEGAKPAGSAPGSNKGGKKKESAAKKAEPRAA